MSRLGAACALVLGAVASLVASLSVAPARAEPPDGHSLWVPAGPSVAFAVPDAEPLAHGDVSAGLVLGYARRPLMRQVACDGMGAGDPSCVLNDGESPAVRERAVGELSVALGLLDALQLGAVLPLAWSHHVDDFNAPRGLESSTALGDARLELQGAFLRGPLAMAARLVTTLPTGDAERGLGSKAVTFMPALVGRVRSGALSVGGELGYRVRPRTRLGERAQDDELCAALGLGVALSQAVELRAEARGGFGEQNVLELLVGAALSPHRSLQVLLGAGGGLPAGEIGMGVPALRILLGARYVPMAASAEVGAPNARPGDADGDGIPDAQDLCAALAEDLDGYMDEDGCPDLDDDGDGVPDAHDECPRQSEDRDGFEDEDGCPDPDNDGDGIPDGIDACSLEPEDLDGFEDDDGCPEPGPKPVAVAIEDGRILVSERIYFEQDRDVIRAVSFAALDRVAEAIATLPASKAVRVEGHTDASGDAAYDLEISYRRARAVVEYLKGRGVPERRLAYRGFGAQQPIAPGRSPDVRALNRRVELVVIDAPR